MNPQTRPNRPGLAPRRLAAQTLKKVLDGAPFTPVDAGLCPDPRDRALANRLVTTALRRHFHLEIVIADLLEKGLPPRSGLFGPALRIGLTELLFMSGRAAHSAVFLAVEILRSDRRGGRYAKLLNAALRRAQREREKWTDIAPESLLPDWLRGRWISAYGQEAVAAAGRALIAGAPLDLTVKKPTPELAEALGGRPVLGDTIRIVERDRSVADLPFYTEGEWWVQDAAAAVPARLFTRPPGARALDLCAAPGGKTAQLCKTGYEVTALDIDAARLATLDANLNRLGYRANLVEADAFAWTPDEKFDVILIDAPCTATGTFRRHPEVLLHRTPKDVVRMRDMQRRLVSRAAGWLAEGGELIFVTCSLEPEEGEDQAAWIAANRPELAPFPLTVGEVPGFTDSILPQGWFRAHPGLALAQGGGTDGFFAARFRLR